MPAPKGSRNNRAYYDKKQKETVADIKAALSSLNTSGIAFKNPSALSKIIAPIVDQSPNNLMKNPIYRVLLDNHVARQKGAADLIDDTSRDINQLKAALRQKELENTNLKTENKRLKKYIENNTIHQNNPKQIKESTHIEKINHESVLAYENTCEAMLLLLNHFEGIFINYIEGTIEDEVARPGEQIVVSKIKAQFFFEYLKKKGFDNG